MSLITTDMQEMAQDKLPDLDTVRNDHRIKLMLEAADRQLEQLGYTEHGARHSMIVAKRAREILKEFGFTERQGEIGAIAGYLHDVGNLIGREFHHISSALLVYPILIDIGFDYAETFKIMGVIAAHEDEDATPTNPIDAAVVIADKSDVHRSRVREWDPHTCDIHDRVNMAATSSKLNVDRKSMTITLDVNIDTSIASVMEYLHIFLDRMDLCLSAAPLLNAQFQLVINGMKMYKEEVTESQVSVVEDQAAELPEKK